MEEKLLGKITFAEFGQCPDRPFLFGLQLEFGLNSSGVGSGGRYTTNISENCKQTREEKLDSLEKVIDFTNKLLEDSKVNYVSELLGKPVEVTLKNNTFKDFRILTEVL